jgi:hypothetical protein
MDSPIDESQKGKPLGDPSMSSEALPQKKSRIERLSESERITRSIIQRQLFWFASDALEAFKGRVRPAGQVKPDPPNEDFGYELIGDDRKFRNRSAKMAALLCEAASFHRWHADEADDDRSFKRILDPKGERNPRAKTLHLLGGACWTLGSRYASGPLLLAIAERHVTAVRLLAGAKRYAVKHGVADELSHYCANLAPAIERCRFDNYIAELNIFERPLTFEAFVKALKKAKLQGRYEGIDLDDNFMYTSFEEWNQRELTRLDMPLSPIATLCLKQSYLNVFHGDGIVGVWEPPREHPSLLAAKGQAAQDEIYGGFTPSSYAHLASYFLVDDQSEPYHENPQLQLGVNPEKREWFEDLY